MKAKRSSIVVSSIMLSLSSLASAELTWNGFLSVGGGVADPDQGDALLDYEDTVTFDNETTMGLQVSGELNDKMSATVQILARGADGYDPQVSWANISYEVNDDLSLRVGRFQTPLYLYSDFLEVGYAYHWISPPDDVYLGAASSADGINVRYQKSMSDFDLSAEFFLASGNEALNLQGGVATELQVRKQMGLVGTLTYDWLTFRAGYSQSDTSFAGFTDAPVPGFGNIAAVIAQLEALPPALVGNAPAQAAEDLRMMDDDFAYSDLAIKAEPGNLLLVLEYTYLDVDGGVVADSANWYATAGYRFGDWLVHVTHSKADGESKDLSAGIPAGIPLGPISTDVYIAVLDGLAAGFTTVRETDTIGVRWDFAPGVAFKAEFLDVDSDNDPTASGNILRFSIDSVF